MTTNTKYKTKRDKHTDLESGYHYFMVNLVKVYPHTTKGRSLDGFLQAIEHTL